MQAIGVPRTQRCRLAPLEMMSRSHSSEAAFEPMEAMMSVLKPGTFWSEADCLSDEVILSRGYYHEIPQIHGVVLTRLSPLANNLGRDCTKNIRLVGIFYRRLACRI